MTAALMTVGVVGAAVAGCLIYISYARLRALQALGVKSRLLMEVQCPSGEVERRHWLMNVNEMTLEMKHMLAFPAQTPRGCARISISLGGLIALVEVANSLQSVGPVAGGDARWHLGLVALGVGVVGAFGCSLVGRGAERKAGKIREEWNTLIRRSTQDVPT